MDGGRAIRICGYYAVGHVDDGGALDIDTGTARAQGGKARRSERVDERDRPGRDRGARLRRRHICKERVLVLVKNDLDPAGDDGVAVSDVDRRSGSRVDPAVLRCSLGRSWR